MLTSMELNFEYLSIQNLQNGSFFVFFTDDRKTLVTV